MTRETAQQREKRLAEALRRNLARRKQQARAAKQENGGKSDNSQ